MENIVIALIGALQVVILGYLEIGRRQVKKQCGTANCVKAIKQALQKDMSGREES